MEITDKTKDTSKSWLVALVKSNYEKKVRERLDDKGIISFLPIQQQRRRWSDRVKIVEVVLIHKLIFVNVENDDRIAVLQTPGVQSYLSDKQRHKPVVIPDVQMNAFIRMVQQKETIVDFNNNSPQKGDAVIVTDGELCGIEGEVISVEGKTKVFVRIPCLGCASIEINPDFLALRNEVDQ